MTDDGNGDWGIEPSDAAPLLWWLSFCDAARPKGQQFLGACIIEGGNTRDRAADLRLALRNAWRHECNPGGDVKAHPIPPEAARLIEKRWIGRLLSRAEADAVGEEVAAKRQHAEGN